MLLQDSRFAGYRGHNDADPDPNADPDPIAEPDLIADPDPQPLFPNLCLAIQ